MCLKRPRSWLCNAATGWSTAGAVLEIESDLLLPVHTAGKITFNSLRGFNRRKIDQTDEEQISLLPTDARHINKAGGKPSPRMSWYRGWGRCAALREPVKRQGHRVTIERQRTAPGMLA